MFVCASNCSLKSFFHLVQARVLIAENVVLQLHKTCLDILLLWQVLIGQPLKDFDLIKSKHERIDKKKKTRESTNFFQLKYDSSAGLMEIHQLFCFFVHATL